VNVTCKQRYLASNLAVSALRFGIKLLRLQLKVYHQVQSAASVVSRQPDTTKRRLHPELSSILLLFQVMSLRNGSPPTRAAWFFRSQVGYERCFTQRLLNFCAIDQSAHLFHQQSPNRWRVLVLMKCVRRCTVRKVQSKQCTGFETQRCCHTSRVSYCRPVGSLSCLPATHMNIRYFYYVAILIIFLRIFGQRGFVKFSSNSAPNDHQVDG